MTLILVGIVIGVTMMLILVIMVTMVVTLEYYQRNDVQRVEETLGKLRCTYRCPLHPEEEVTLDQVPFSDIPSCSICREKMDLIHLD